MTIHALDLTAQLILATLYTHYHIDGPVYGVPPGTKPSKIPQAVAASLQQARAHQQSTVAIYQAQNSDIGLVSHVMPADPNGYKASEVYENCVAVMVVDGELFFAYNFKARRNSAAATTMKTFQAFEYSNYTISDQAIQQIIINLKAEIRAGREAGTPPWPGEEILDTVTKVTVVEPIVQPTNEIEAAQFHAEMQLMSYYAESAERIPKDNYIGVNKPCCENCTRIFKKFGVLFAGSHGKKVTNWKSFSTMRARARRTVAL